MANAFVEWQRKKKKEEEEKQAALTAKEKAMGGEANAFVEWQRKQNAAATTDDTGQGATWTKNAKGNVAQQILGTVGDTALGLTTSFGEFFEGVYDLGVLGISRAADALGADEVAEKLQQHAEYEWMRDWAKDKVDYVDQYSVLGDKSDRLVEGVGGVLAQATTGGLGGYAPTIATGLSGMGQGVVEAYKNDATHEQAWAYGLGKGVSEALIEGVSGGFSKGLKALGISRGIGGLDDMFAKKVANTFFKAISNETVQKVLGNVAEAVVKGGGEALEEYASAHMDAFLQWLTYRSDEDLNTMVKDSNALEAAMYGFLTSGIMQGVDVVKSTANKTDYVTGMTSAEEKVINKAAEQEIAKREANGEKLTKKDKNEIYEKFTEDISKGYISIDTIEETLGGDKYTEYKKASDENAALKKELDELRKMESGKMNDIQRERLAELKAMNLDDTSKIDELKKQMSDDVLNLVKSERKGKGSLLMESYNEQQRLGQGFVANYDSIKGKKYEDAARQTIDNAVKAGANNSNRVHDLVDMAAKLSSETGIVYKFGGNEAVKADFIQLQNENLAKLEAIENPNETQLKEIDKIKELIRKVESGETTVNGNFTGKGIMLNLDSPKLLNTVVGHEMTHTLEQTKHYEALQKALFTYAKTKGVDIDAKIAELTELYNGVDGADAKAELTADLIGDYLFNDYDFVKTLAKDRNVFQRMWDRVKYLGKLATAGSKEARELARLERMFAKAYQEANATKNTATTRYSFAGENAQAADKGLLAKAEAMVAEGTDAETIRQETGWFKSYDGKWRYEIDDSIAEWHIDTAEPNRHRLFTFGEKIYRLEDLLDHPQLYEAYPQLRDVQVWDNPSHAHGQGNVVGRNTDSMAIGGLTNDTTTKWSILHELQHIIQNIEGFARGSSKYEFTQKEWGDNEYDAFEKRNQVARKLYNILRRHGVSVSNDAIYNEQNYGYGYKVSDDIIENNYWTLNSLAQQNERTQKLVDEYYEQVQILNATTPEGQYHNTAGEIEAYDTMARMRMSAEERKAQRPNIDNPNAIVLGVSEDAVSYISAKDNNNSSIKEQLREHLSEVNEMESVANITYERGDKNKLRSLAIESFKAVGYVVERKNFGAVLIGESQITDSLKYLNNDAECAALLAVPKVIKRGIDISGHNNHKGRSYDTYTLAAPVTINGVTGDMAVVIRRTGKNRYYTHRILMPDGSEFIFKEIKKTEPTNADMLAHSDNQGTAIGSAYDNSISQNSEKSSGLENISENSDLAPTQFSLSENASYAEITEEQQKLYQRERDLEQRKRIANNNPELLRAMDEYHSLFEEMRELLPKRRTGTATQAELDRIEEIKTLRDEKMQQLTELQESLGLSEIAKEEQEIRETKEALRVAADTAWANEGAAKENAAIEKSGLSAEEYFRKKALQAFKTTTNFNEAGYMLPDGKMLNFSGGERNHRYRDHREIGEIYEATQGTDALNRFLNDGNIRIMAESPGIDLAAGVEPTQEQYDTLRRFIKSHGVNEGQFFVDISDADGRRVGQYAYEGRVNVERVINDIKYFYQTGEVREQSSIGQFLSLSTENVTNPVGHRGVLGSQFRVQENIAPLTMDNVEAPTSLNGVDNAGVYAPTPTDADAPMARGGTNAVDTKDMFVDHAVKERKKANWWNTFRTHVLDDASVFEDLAKKTKNRELEAKFNFTKSSKARAQSLIGNGKKDAGIKSLTSIREAVEKTGKTAEFEDYMYHLLNIDRMTLEDRYEGKSNVPVWDKDITADISEAKVRQYEAQNPQFKQLADDVYKFVAYERQLMVDNGIISQETADLWQEQTPHYVPLKRAVEDEGYDISKNNGKKVKVDSVVKRVKGGNQPIEHLFDTIASRTERVYDAIAKNNFGLELKNTLNSVIDSDVATQDDVDNGVDRHDDLLQAGKEGKNPTFTVFENGEKVTFEISHDMYEALKPTEEMWRGTNKVLNKINNIRRGLLTEYSPKFMINNPIKDTQDVLFNSQHAIKTYTKFPEAARQLATKGKWFTEYIENGGEQNTYFEKDGGFTKDDTGIKKLIGIPLNKISNINQFIERIPRLAEYIASRESGASIETAMLDAARVTTNFQAGGDITKFFNRNGATFLNASVQGFMQNVRNVREAKMNGLKGVMQLVGKTMIAGLPALIANHLLWGDDEEYEELSDYVKDNYYIVAKYDDGKFVRIPKGRTAAVIQDAFEQMANLITGNDEVDLESFFSLVMNNLAPNNIADNNIIAPLTQAWSNTTWYGDDLVPTRLADLPAKQQYDESTDAISKWLGEKTNISPYKINYVLDQYSGAVGDFVLPMLTPEAERGDNKLLAPLADAFTTDSTMKNQNVSDFYDTVDKLTVNANDIMATDEDILKSKYMNSVSSEMGDLYKKKREIQNSNLSDSAKYNAVREVQKQINELAENALKTYNAVYVHENYARVGDRYYHTNDKGEWEKISDKQYDKMTDVTGELGISRDEYWGNKEEYDYAYEYPEKYAIAQAIGGYDTYKKYTTEIGKIEGVKGANGKTISGSKKKNIVNYIESLNIDAGEKMILYRSMYKTDDQFNAKIVKYLEAKEDMTYEEKLDTLRALGFTVDKNGNIWW